MYSLILIKDEFSKTKDRKRKKKFSILFTICILLKLYESDELLLKVSLENEKLPISEEVCTKRKEVEEKRQKRSLLKEHSVSGVV